MHREDAGGLVLPAPDPRRARHLPAAACHGDGALAGARAGLLGAMGSVRWLQIGEIFRGFKRGRGVVGMDDGGGRRRSGGNHFVMRGLEDYPSSQRDMLLAIR